MQIVFLPDISANSDAKDVKNVPKLEIIGHYRPKTMELTEMMINWTHMDLMEATKILLGWGTNSPRAILTGFYKFQ